MGLLILAGLVGSALYSGHVVKQEIEATITDTRTEATLNSKTNRNRIENNFTHICKRSSIKTKDNKPINDNNINIAIEYLKYQGYTDNDIEYFKTLFYNKLHQHQANVSNNMYNRYQKLLNFAKNNQKQQKVILRKTIYRSNLPPQERINKLLENELWNEIVHHQSYIKSDIVGRWEEIWTLYVPQGFFGMITKNELYKKICNMQDVQYSL